MIGRVTFTVELAISIEEKIQGLSGRDSLAEGTGMAFLYERDGLLSFWMRGMKIPLDFIWIGGDCTVAEILRDVPPPKPGTPENQLPLYIPSRPVRHVLEINGGAAQRLGVVNGDRVVFSGERLASWGCPPTREP